MCGFVCGLVDKMFPSPPPTVPSLFLVTVPSSSSCHHICFSSCCIPVFPKRIPTCGFDELTHSHTLLLSVPIFSLSQPLFFFSVPQAPPSVQTDMHTAETHESTCTNPAHMLLSFIGFPLSIALSSDVSHDHQSVSVVLQVDSCLFLYSLLVFLCDWSAVFKHDSLMTTASFIYPTHAQ